MPVTTTIRVAIADRDIAQELARQTGRSQLEIVHEALELYRRERLLTDMNHSFAALRRDPVAWNEEMAEREAWDSTFGDAPSED